MPWFFRRYNTSYCKAWICAILQGMLCTEGIISEIIRGHYDIYIIGSADRAVFLCWSIIYNSLYGIQAYIRLVEVSMYIFDDFKRAGYSIRLFIIRRKARRYQVMEMMRIAREAARTIGIL